MPRVTLKIRLKPQIVRQIEFEAHLQGVSLEEFISAVWIFYYYENAQCESIRYFNTNEDVADSG